MDICRLRLANQHIARPTFEDPAEVVRWFGAVQAQDYLGGLWALGLRTRGATEASVERSIESGAFVRTWPMRGTLHFVAAEDVRWMLTLLTPRVIAATSSRRRQLEIDQPTLARSARVTEKVLVGGKRLRRDELYAVWNDAGIATHDSRGQHILGHLAHTGVICFGPRNGKQHTLTLVEEWLPGARLLERDIALGGLARRYFTSHGPATIHDFAWWSGLRISDARAGLESVKSELESETLGGRLFWFRAPQALGRVTNAVHLLPAWDEYTVAYRDRTDILEPRHARRVNAGGGVLKPVVVSRGKVIGTWLRKIGKGEVIVRPKLFARVDSAVKEAINTAVRRYETFLS